MAESAKEVAERCAGPYHDRACGVNEDNIGDHPCNCLRESRVAAIEEALKERPQELTCPLVMCPACESTFGVKLMVATKAGDVGAFVEGPVDRARFEAAIREAEERGREELAHAIWPDNPEGSTEPITPEEARQHYLLLIAEARRLGREEGRASLSHFYPHMCRDGHDEVGWRGDSELCPVCRALPLEGPGEEP